MNPKEMSDARERLAKHFYEEAAERFYSPVAPWEEKSPWWINLINSSYGKADAIINIMFPEDSE